MITSLFKIYLPKFAKSVVRSGIAVAILLMAVTPLKATDYYLRGFGSPNPLDGVPVATLSTSPPFVPFLINFDPGRDSLPGLMIQKGGSNVSEADPTKYQTWFLPGGEIDIDGPAAMTVWLAMKDFDTSGKRGRIVFHLVECDPGGGNCTSLKSEEVDSTTWSGGWDRFDLDFGNVNRSISTGKVFGIKAFVRSNSDDDMMIAYGSTRQSSKASVTPAGASSNDVNLQVVKSANTSSAYVGGTIAYTIQYNCVSTIAAGQNVRITDVLDPHLAVTGLTDSPHIASSSYDSGTNTATFQFVDPLPAGSSGEVRILAEFQPGVADGYVAPNTATMSASNGADVDSNTVNVEARVDTSSGPSYTKGVRVEKWAAGGELDLPYEYVYYDIRHGNTGNVGEDIENYVVTDIFPTELKLREFNVGEFPGTTGTVSVYYQTASNSSWQFQGTRNTDNDDSYFRHADFGLVSGDYVTALRFDFGTLPGGSGFHPDSPGVEPIDINLEPVDSSTLVIGSTLTNCANLVGNDVVGVDSYDEDACTGVVVAGPSADFHFSSWDDTGTGPYDVGETMRMGNSFGLEWDSGVGLVNPTIMNLLPVGFTFSGNESFAGDGYNNAGQPVHNIEVIPDFAGTTRELVRLTFPGGLTLSPTGGEQPIYFYFDMEVVTGAQFGVQNSEQFGTWESPADGAGVNWRVQDLMDYDSDGDTTELMAKSHGWWSIGDPGGGVASLDSVMGVKGELDSDFSRYPDSGLTVPSGQADYELSITNSGGVALKDLVLIEILPLIGDRGVIDLSERDSEWAPFLVAEVTAPAGLQVYYSTSGNPCRDELTPGIPAGCEDPAWTTALPGDPTTVKSLKFEHEDGRWLMPGETLDISWPMRAAINAPTNGEIAWSSFGVVATRADNNQRMLPSEPMKVGIGIQPPQPPFFGDTVWFDANRDGIQDAGEVGINGVRVELYEDDGDGVANPNVDTLYSFTLTSNDGTDDGKYLFPYLPPSDYFAVFYVPDDHGVSPANAGSDLVDSDGDLEMFGGAPVTVTAVTTISALELDMSWDQGFYDRSALPAVWAIAELGGGSIVIGGKFQSSHGVQCGNIAVLGSNGTPSAGFRSGSGFNGIVRALAVSDQGKILVGGEFTSYDGNPAHGLALLDGDGSFVNGVAMPNTNDVRWVGASGSNFYVAGAFSSLGGAAAPCIGRLNGTGQVDSSFQIGAGADGAIHTAAISGGGVIIGGSFSSYQGNPAKSIAKIKSDGSFDTGFDSGEGFDGPINSITVKGGNIFAVGEFSSCDNHPVNGAARLSMNGAVDTSYDGGSSLSVSSNRASN